MKIFTEDNWHKVGNFIDYLLEHFNEKGKHYKLKLKAEDVYDKKLINKRIQSLHKNLLIGYEDSFEILDSNLLEDFENFKKQIAEFVSQQDVLDKLSNKNFKNQVIEFDLEFIEKEKFASLSFNFINLDKI